jgi:sugar O-acyltransferase (sialic acid O-acetyltransferase NeuD family)
VLDILELEGQYRVIGLLDSFELRGKEKYGHMVCGRAEDAVEISKQYECRAFFVAVGDNWRRWQLASRLISTIPGVQFPAVIHPSALISKTATIGAGTVIMAAGVIGPNAVLGEGCIVNIASSVNHDCRMEPYSSLSAGVHLGGGSVIGMRSSLGLASSLREKAVVGKDTVVGAGAVVINDLPGGVVAFGVPAKVRRQRAPDERYMR